jgi:hypothetical protein
VLVDRAGIGLLLDGRWFCSADCIQFEAARRLRRARRAPSPASPAPALRLGSVLMRQAVLTPGQVREALDVQRASGLKFGAQLVQLGFTTAAHVLQGLSIQEGVPYLASIDASSVRSAPGGLTRHEVEALGVVPFHQADDELLVACAAPVARAAIAALEALLRTSIEPFLVADADLERLMAAYGTAASEVDAEPALARDVEEGASRIAAMAERVRSVEMTTALIEPFMWVRINGGGSISTVLVPPVSGAIEGGESWLAATTRH